MENSLNQFDLWTGLFGGLALFLFGMDLMTKALKRAAGDHMKELLGKMTRNRFFGAAMGAVTTAVVNSSSVTTVILVGFISAGLMSTAQSVSVIMGANIGSTMTAQILAFKVSQFALPMITIGFLLTFVSKLRNAQEYGHIILSMGLVFFGMGVMSDAMAPLRSYEPFIAFISTLSHPALAALVGAAFTAVIQSSAATTGIVIVLAAQQLIGLEAAVAVALGANVGTCATAGLAVINKPRPAVRAALVHVLFNVAGVLIWIGLIPELAEISRAISPSDGPDGTLNTPRQIANAHTIFNIANTLIFIGFTPQIARLVEWMIPDRLLSGEETLAPKFLDDNVLSTPSIALENTRYEIDRMGQYVREMLHDSRGAALGTDRRRLDALEARDKPVDKLHRAIVTHLGRISVTSLSDQNAQTLIQFLEIANDLEHIGDRIASDIVTSTRKRLDEGATLGKDSVAQITTVYNEVEKALSGALEAVKNKDINLATTVRAMKQNVSEVSHKAGQQSFNSVRAQNGGGVLQYVREAELIEILDGIFKTARRIARSELQNAETTSY
jgi:phosphate:Na+ symporter